MTYCDRPCMIRYEKLKMAHLFLVIPSCLAESAMEGDEARQTALPILTRNQVRLKANARLNST